MNAKELEFRDQLKDAGSLIEDMQIHEQIQSRMKTPKEQRLLKPEGMSTYEWVRTMNVQVEE